MPREDVFLNDDDLFGGTPTKKYFDILFNANRNLVEYYLTQNLEKIAVLEHLLEEKMDEDIDLEKIVRNFAINNPEIIEKKLTDLYISDMGNILSQNE